MIKNRCLTKYVTSDLTEKMVFIAGPRQVGKTTLAKDIVAKQFAKPQYFNWDNRTDRKKILQSEWPGNADLIILDEIHKYKEWKAYVIGEYDTLD